MPLEPGKKPRAKNACRVCNSRRVRCNVNEIRPCSNCQTAGANCEVLPSRRGRYPRRSRRQPSAGASTSGSPGPSVENTRTPPTTIHAAPAANLSPTDPVLQPQSSQVGLQAQTNTPAPSAASVPGTLFFGESNFLTLVPGRAQPGDEPATAGATSHEKGRLLFPHTHTATPQSQGKGESPVSIAHLSAGTARYLRDEGALTFPDHRSCLPALQAYFTWFHPCFPVVDRSDIARRLPTMDISRLLLQAMLFIGATYCDDSTILEMGFKDRTEAKSLLYTRARLLFHADWEKDEITLIQSLFLVSFWRGDKFDVRDVRYWLGVAITFAESYGLHRSTRTTTQDSRMARMRRRIWWSIYVRERQSAASLGLPSRIRDEDCDIEPLSVSDFESPDDSIVGSFFGSCKSEHITYAMKMVELARLLGKVIDLHFVPGRPPSTAEEVQNLDRSLGAWRQNLPENMKGESEGGVTSVWTCLLQLAYNHLRILIYRNAFLRNTEGDCSKQVALTAACQISRTAEDMLSQGILRYGQMHLITSLFAALCIHAISIRRAAGVLRRIAEHRAQMCLLGLKEIQKYWRINNNVLDLFLQYLDDSIAKRLHGNQADATTTTNTITTTENGPPLVAGRTDSTDEGPVRTGAEFFEDQWSSFLNGHWGSDDAPSDLGFFLDPQLHDNPTQVEGMDFLERSL